jgi:hypothetical protein
MIYSKSSLERVTHCCHIIKVVKQKLGHIEVNIYWVGPGTMSGRNPFWSGLGKIKNQQIATCLLLEPQEDLGAFVSNVIDTHHESIDSRGVLCRCTRDTKLTRLACGCVIYLPPIPDIPYVSSSSSSTQFPFPKNVPTLMDMKEETKMKKWKNCVEYSISLSL